MPNPNQEEELIQAAEARFSQRCDKVLRAMSAKETCSCGRKPEEEHAYECNVQVMRRAATAVRLLAEQPSERMNAEDF
jgi:hypothetical protein